MSHSTEAGYPFKFVLPEKWSCNWSFFLWLLQSRCYSFVHNKRFCVSPTLIQPPPNYIGVVSGVPIMMGNRDVTDAIPMGSAAAAAASKCFITDSPMTAAQHHPSSERQEALFFWFTIGRWVIAASRSHSPPVISDKNSLPLPVIACGKHPWKVRPVYERAALSDVMDAAPPTSTLSPFFDIWSFSPCVINEPTTTCSICNIYNSVPAPQHLLGDRRHSTVNTMFTIGSQEAGHAACHHGDWHVSLGMLDAPTGRHTHTLTLTVGV